MLAREAAESNGKSKFPRQMAKASTSKETVSSMPVHLDDAASHQGFPPGLVGAQNWMSLIISADAWTRSGLTWPNREDRLPLILGIVSDFIVAGRTTLLLQGRAPLGLQI